MDTFNYQLKTHVIGGTQIAEILGDGCIIQTAEDGLDILGNLYYQGFDKVILHQSNLTPQFFDLKNGLAGEILQKFSNYRVRLAIVGSLSHYTSKSLSDFIYESNKGHQIRFVAETEEAIRALSSN